MLSERVVFKLVLFTKSSQAIEDIKIFNLSDRDVVRHPLIQKIIKAYERADRK